MQRIALKNKVFQSNQPKAHKEHILTQNGQRLMLSPQEAIFKDTEPGQIYQMKVLIKNNTSLKKRVRVYQPKSPAFRCDYQLVESIAPGLSTTLLISYSCIEEGEFQDSIVITTEDEQTYELPILAFSPQAKIIFEPLINLGFIQVGSTSRETVTFKNEGNAVGTVDFSSGEARGLKIEPLHGFSL